MLARGSCALVLTSPLKRAQETCELTGLGDRAQVDADLLEWNYGAYERLTSGEIHERAPGWLLFTDGALGGERPDDVGRRVDRAIARARAAAGNVAVVAHGHLLRALAVRWLGWPVAAGRHFFLDTRTVNVLSVYRQGPAIKRWNGRRRADGQRAGGDEHQPTRNRKTSWVDRRHDEHRGTQIQAEHVEVRGDLVGGHSGCRREQAMAIRPPAALGRRRATILGRHDGLRCG